MNKEIPIIGKQKTCAICGKGFHPFNTKCNYQDLVERVKILLNMNHAIPSVLQANSEAVKSTQEFQYIAKNAVTSLELLEETVKESWFGKRILKKWNKKMEALWASQTSSPDTKDQLAISSHESTTPSEMPNKLSIVPTQPGENTAPDSLL